MPAGWLIGVIVVVLALPTLLSMAIGLPLVAIGEAIRIWASGHIEKTKVLATGGPYAHCRHPLYVGSLFIALGAAIASASVWVVLAVAAYFLAFFPSVMREESDFLAKKFPEEHAAWADSVPPFLPRLTPGGSRSSRFEWSSVSRNREWRTVVALPLIAILLCARSGARRLRSPRSGSRGSGVSGIANHPQFVELDAGVADTYGIPALRIKMTWGPNEHAMIDDQAVTAAEMMEAAGARDVEAFTLHDREPGRGIHEVGIARMGTNPRTSVLNGFQQSHDVANLFVMDGSGFMSSACQNPTLTIMALAVRSSDYVLEQMRTGDL